MESAADLEPAALQVKKSQMGMDGEQELARADMETLKDTAPVLEGIKVIWKTRRDCKFVTTSAETGSQHNKLLSISCIYLCY